MRGFVWDATIAGVTSKILFGAGIRRHGMRCMPRRRAVVVSQSVGEQIRYFHSGMHTPSVRRVNWRKRARMWPPPPSLSAIMRTEEGKGERERPWGPLTASRERENAVINRLRDVFARAYQRSSRRCGALTREICNGKEGTKERS